MLKKEAEILYWFAREPWKKYNFTEIKKVTKKRSRSYIANVINKLIKEGVLKKEAIAHLPFYSLNVISEKAEVFAGFILEYFGWNKKHIPYQDLQKIMDKIPVKDYVFIITGSYARGKQTKQSDIDVVILIDNFAKPKKVYAELSHYCELSIPQIHLYVFRHKEFLEMLCNRKGNYGKEITKNNLILTGGQVYIRLIQEAMQNGYNN